MKRIKASLDPVFMNLRFIVFILTYFSVGVFIFDGFFAFHKHLNPKLIFTVISLLTMLSVCYSIIAPMIWNASSQISKKWKPLYIPFLFTATILFYVAFGMLIVSILMGKPGAFYKQFWFNFKVNIIPMMAVGWLVSYSEKGLKELRAERSRKEMAEKAAAKAQSLLLQNMIHAHSLANGANDIAGLVRGNPDAAIDSLAALSDFCRESMKIGKGIGTHTLAHEKALIEHYLSFESIRLGDRLSVQWRWDSHMDGLVLPPLLFQPMVENAIKHGIAKNVKGGTLHIIAERKGERARLAVTNTIEPEKDVKVHGHDGFGMQNLMARLKLIFGDQASFAVRNEGELVVSEIYLEACAIAEQ